MVNKCVAYGCQSGYDETKTKVRTYVAMFRFPLNNKDLLVKWVHFVNRSDWKPTSNSVLCEKHFDSKFINRGKRCKLRWELNPIPSIHSEGVLKRPSTIPTPLPKRKPPAERIFQQDELNIFLSNDKIVDFSQINEKFAPKGYMCNISEEHAVFYNLQFDENTGFPKILESIKVDKNMHVQLQYNGYPLPLPPWFVRGSNACLKRKSDLENFPSYIKSICDGNENSLIHEMQERLNYKPKGRPPYSSQMIRFALHLRYTSLQAYKVMLEKFPLPSISLLNTIQQGGVDALKALKLLLESNKVSSDCILMIDEMYLQKAAQYQDGDYVGADENGELYKGIIVFMIAGLTKSINYVVKAIPEVRFNGNWLSIKISETIESLSKIGFKVRGVVTDNHSANVTAFNCLLADYGNDSNLYIKHPSCPNVNTYLFYDTVHLFEKR